MPLEKVAILGIHVDVVTMEEAVEKVEGFLRKRQNALVATANAEMIMMAEHDRELFDILNGADLVVPDGAGTVWAARKLGVRMPERVAGYDLVQNLLARAPQSGIRVYFLGAAPGVALKAKAAMEHKYQGIQIVGVRDGYFKKEEEDGVLAEVRAAAPDLLLVALGVPRQEKWMRAHLASLGVPVAIGVGGSFDVMAGVVKRAPVWMQKAKMEWLFRGALQPKRIGRLMALPKFVLKVHSSKKH